MSGFVAETSSHQILQLHNVLSNRVPHDSQVSMVWDGFFHAFTLTAVAVGIVLLWRAVTRPGALLSRKAVVGAVLWGWGLFNLVEGTIDHEILQIHHVYQNGNHLLWDMVFLVSGVVLAAAGWLLLRSGFGEALAADRKVCASL